MMASKSELSSRLIEVGLSTRIDFWLKLLKKEGANSLITLSYLEGDEGIYSKFEKKAKNIVEKRALAILLKIDDKADVKREPQVQKQSTAQKPQSSMLPIEKHAKLLMDNLNLHQYYDKKLSIMDAVTVRLQALELSLQISPICDMKQLPFLLLHKIMSYDFSCMSDLVNIKGQAPGDSDDENECISPLKGIHPVDCLISLLMCCDSFLCQDLYYRLSKCQLAIPFILPDPIMKQLIFPFWEMSSIILDWKTLSSKTEVTQHTVPLTDSPMPIISFIRIGETQKSGISKSKMLNDVIGDRHHEYFFHHDCSGGHYNRYVGEGLVDMFWYLPNGESNATFKYPVLFLNLHGDSRNHEVQTKLLSKISSMCFVIIAEENIVFDTKVKRVFQEFSKKCGFVLLCLHELSPAFLSTFSEASIINLKHKNSPQVTHLIQKRIKKSEDNLNKLEINDIKHKIIDFPIKMRNDSQRYHEGMNLSQKILKIVVENKGGKEKLLPLQGKNLWRAWAIEDKEYHRQSLIGSEMAHNYIVKVDKKKKYLRQKQFDHMKNLTPLMNRFIESLQKLKGQVNFESRYFFLHSLRLQLNKFSTFRNFEKQNEFFLLKSQMQDVTKKRPTGVQGSIAIQDKLKRLQEDIIECSFGLEHFFREIGQMYEAAHAQHHQEKYSQFPEIAAELFIEGYPMEIMDGDACHVPLKWVQAVLEIAEQKLKNPKIFVLSVLGLQSTGKSTMLNTTFGLQLSVSAGRCTRGAFMQLVPLDEDFTSKTDCSYILIIDTEGLRAPHIIDPIEAQKHDNELATFVIGLANTSLININGEVPGDMDNILQTSVHAFLRMNEIKYKPSCQLVHQNAVIDVRNKIGQDSFVEKLDKFTAIAAQEEHCAGKYKCFNDVINFNAETDIHHFPGLWEGSPPMATISKGYSRAAQNLKRKILDIISLVASRTGSASDKKFYILSLQHFQQRIEDLWQSLLKEDFVFSFKNSLEVNAFNKLEKEYYAMERSFKLEIAEWERRAENAIKHVPNAQLQSKVQELLKSLRILVSELLLSRQKEMEKYFNGSDKSLIAQWKAKFEKKLLSLSKEQEQHADTLCTRLQQSRLAISTFEKVKEKNIGYIKYEVEKHIASIRKEHESLQRSISRKQLSAKQMKELLKSDLFTSQKLERYREMEIITEDQEADISKILSDSSCKVTEQSLNSILFGGIIQEEEITKILKRVEQPEEVLKAEFDKIWDVQIKSLPETMPLIKVFIPSEVQTSLIRFVGEGDANKIRDKLTSKDLIAWGQPDLVRPSQSSSFMQFIKILFPRYSREPENQSKATELMNLMIENIKVYLADKVQEKIGFHSIYTEGLLSLVDDTISQFDSSGAIVDLDYRCNLFLFACGYAIPTFEEMQQSFEEQNDPKVYLEKREKEPLFIKFKNIYRLKKAEEVIADTLCAYMAEPIREQLRNTLPNIMVGKMMKSEHYFFNTMAFKVKVLIDLYNESNFQSYMKYLRNVKDYLEEKLQDYTKKYCYDQHQGSTRLQKAAKDEIYNLIGVVQNAVDEVDGANTDINDWIKELCDDESLLNELGINLQDRNLLEGYGSLEDFNVANFKKEIYNGLKQLMKKLEEEFHSVHYDTINWTTAKEMLNTLIGCTTQCPFCGEQCDRLNPHTEDIDHVTAIHRINCLKGWRWTDSKVLTTDFCQTLITTSLKFKIGDKGYHPYKNYKEVHTDWSIPPDATSDTSLYWKFFVGRFKNELATEYNAYPPKVPPEWSQIGWEDVKRNLEKLYNVKINE